MELGYALRETYGIICRAGLHCFPDAYKTIGAGSYIFWLFQAIQDVNTFISALMQISHMVKPKTNKFAISTKM